MSDAGLPTPAQGRLCIVAAAVLWSTSGAFVNLLTEPTALHLNEPRPDHLVMAFYRCLFAGAVLSLALCRRNFSYRPLMLVMVLCFALMNVTFVSALALGRSADAILLQYTAPMWMYVASVWLLREPSERRGTVALAMGLVGIGVIIAGGWQGEQFWPAALGLTSGVTYAGVLICLRLLRRESSRWLTALNHLCGALVLLPWMWVYPTPTPAQLAVLGCFGVFQMASAYWLVARGLRVVSPQEAGTLTLLEPLLNPLWAYLISPQKEALQPATYLGGALILGGLAWRYWPSWFRHVPPRSRGL
jgi:drug/metabolite transporter (DMT)-like permease